MFEVFSTPTTDRFLEDYKEGATYLCGSFTISEDEIIAFARRYDPQPMHVDPAFAAEGPFGAVIASGWHTVSSAMRLVVENYLPHDNLASPGIDELRWLRPVRPGDTLTLHVTVREARRSRSKPDRGMIHSFMELLNQDGEVAMSMKPMNLVRVRNP
jgi:acyl dehydratase